MNEELRQELDKIWQKIAELEKNNKLVVDKGMDTSLSGSDSFFDVDGDILTVLKVVGNNTKEKTQNMALLALLGYKEKLNKEKIMASEIKKNVAINKIPVENFATYVNELIPQSILRDGKIGSKHVTYKLTNFGYAKAKELISIENEQSK